MPHRRSFLLAVLLTTGTDLVAQRRPDTRLNTNPLGSAVENRARSQVRGDRIWVVWQDTRSGTSDIRCNRSFDRGASWLAADVQLDVGLPAANSITPEIAVAGNFVHVVWQDLRSSPNRGDIYYNRSTDGGVSWLLGDLRLDTGSAPGAADSHTPVVYAAGSTVCVVWADTRNGSADIYGNRSLDGGATWLPTAVRIDAGDVAGSSISLAPRVAGDGNTVHVVWEDARGGNRDVYYNRSGDGGATWLPAAVRLDHAPAPAFATDPRLACEGTQLNVVWVDDRNGLTDIYANRSLDGGTSWLSTDGRLDTDAPGGGGSTKPRVVASGAAVYVAWEDYRTFVQPQIFFRRSIDGGTSWLGSDRLVNTSTASCYSFDPSLAAHGSLVCIAWDAQVCGGGGMSDIYGNRSLDGGATWLPADVRLDTDPVGSHHSYEPDVHVDGDRCSVVWHDFRSLPGRSEIVWNVPFGLLPYGAGTPGTGGLTPHLTGTGRGTLGELVSFDLGNAVGGTVGALLLGGPGSKIAVPFLGGTVLVSPVTSLGFAASGAPGLAGAGAASLPLAIPASASLVGFELNAQAVLLDAGAAVGLALTNGVEAWIG